MEHVNNTSLNHSDNVQNSNDDDLQYGREIDIRNPNEDIRNPNEDEEVDIRNPNEDEEEDIRNPNEDEEEDIRNPNYDEEEDIRNPNEDIRNPNYDEEEDSEDEEEDSEDDENTTGLGSIIDIVNSSSENSNILSSLFRFMLQMNNTQNENERENIASAFLGEIISESGLSLDEMNRSLEEYVGTEPNHIETDETQNILRIEEVDE